MIEVSILGPLEVRRDGELVSVHGREAAGAARADEVADEPFAHTEALGLEDRAGGARRRRSAARAPRRPAEQALYASGRQADALAVYRDLRRRLVDELAIEPSPELQALAVGGATSG